MRVDTTTGTVKDGELHMYQSNGASTREQIVSFAKWSTLDPTIMYVGVSDVINTQSFVVAMDQEGDIYWKIEIFSNISVNLRDGATDKWDNLYICGDNDAAGASYNVWIGKISTLEQTPIWVKEFEAYRISDGWVTWYDITATVAVSEYGNYVFVNLLSNQGVSVSVWDTALLKLNGVDGSII